MQASLKMTAAEKQDVAKADDAASKTPEKPKKETTKPNQQPEANPEDVIEPDEKKRGKANALVANRQLPNKRNYAKAAKTLVSLALAKLRSNAGRIYKNLLELDQISRARVYAEKASRLAPKNAEVFLFWATLAKISA